MQSATTDGWAPDSAYRLLNWKVEPRKIYRYRTHPNMVGHGGVPREANNELSAWKVWVL
jgi:hypothetical protein